MGLRITEVDENTVAHVFRHEPAKATHQSISTVTFMARSSLNGIRTFARTFSNVHSPKVHGIHCGPLRRGAWSASRVGTVYLRPAHQLSFHQHVFRYLRERGPMCGGGNHSGIPTGR